MFYYTIRYAKYQRFLYNWYYHFMCLWPDMLKLPKITSLLFLCNILWKKWVMMLIFLQANKHESFIQIDTMTLMGLVKYSSFAIVAALHNVFTISQKKTLEMKLIFCMQIKHQISQQVDFNTLDIKVSYKVALSLLMSMIKHSQSTQSNKFAISLKYSKKEVRDGVHFLHAFFCVFEGSSQTGPKYPK